MKFRLRIIIFLLVILSLCPAALTHAQAGHLEADTLTRRQYLPLTSTPPLSLNGGMISLFPSFPSTYSECSATAPKGTDGLHLWIPNPTPQWQTRNTPISFCIWLIQNLRRVSGVGVLPRAAFALEGGIPYETGFGTDLLDEDG